MAVAHIKRCQFCDKTATPAADSLQVVLIPSYPWEKLAMDVVGPFETAPWDSRYAPHTDGLVQLVARSGLTAPITTLKVISFITSVFSRFSNLRTSDNGCQLTSAEFITVIVY